MKMKYTASIALLAWLLVAGWMASMVIAKPAVLRIGNQADETTAMAELRNGIARNRLMMESIAELRGATPYFGPSELVALPASQSSPADGTRPGGGWTAASSEPVMHAVSVVLVADGRRSAIVNGQHVRTGSRLANGARISGIGADWVRIDDPATGEQTYRVRDPLRQQGEGGRP